MGTQGLWGTQGSCMSISQTLGLVVALVLQQKGCTSEGDPGLPAWAQSVWWWSYYELPICSPTIPGDKMQAEA